MYRFYLLVIIIVSISANCQNSVDQIVIKKNLYQNKFDGTDSLYKTEIKTVTDKSTISQLVEGITKNDDSENLLAVFEIDSNYIKNNSEELLNLYSGKEIVWNTKQKEFIINELKNIENFKIKLSDYLSNGCCYTMHSSYKNEYILDFKKEGNSLYRYTSRKHIWGYKFPWKNEMGKSIYNFQVDNLIDKIFGAKSKTEKPLKSDKLLKYLVNKIIDSKQRKLYQLSSFTYIKEIEELKSNFKVISHEELYGRGRYIWDENKVIKVRLHDDNMLSNVNLLFLAKVEDGKLYSRDSIKNEAPRIIKRIQDINFIRQYLINNEHSRLDTYYFNNNSITDYTIDGINKSPKEWKNHDNYLKGLKYYEKNNIKPNFDIEQAIENSTRVNCGCNYRFEKSYLEQGIFFELFGEEGDSSIWVLLPDNKLLLYIMDNDKVINLNLKGYENKHGIKFPCKLFNADGIELKK
ncbi:hypothetical protein [Flavobacterium suncheonense]|uniref:hypothetical protein n=1 Tax=Flavobacterium suncheonense TaxID=350894 RepID=UPI003FA3C5E1